MAKKNIVMSNSVILEGEKKIYCRATEMILKNYIVAYCGIGIKNNEKKIKGYIIEKLGIDMKGLGIKLVLKMNKYLPNDQVTLIDNDVMKYYILVELGQIKRNEYYEEEYPIESIQTKHFRYNDYVGDTRERPQLPAIIGGIAVTDNGYILVKNNTQESQKHEEKIQIVATEKYGLAANRVIKPNLNIGEPLYERTRLNIKKSR